MKENNFKHFHIAALTTFYFLSVSPFLMVLQGLPSYILMMSVMLKMRLGVLMIGLLATADAGSLWSGQG